MKNTCNTGIQRIRLWSTYIHCNVFSCSLLFHPDRLSLVFRSLVFQSRVFSVTVWVMRLPKVIHAPIAVMLKYHVDASRRITLFYPDSSVEMRVPPSRTAMCRRHEEATRWRRTQQQRDIQPRLRQIQRSRVTSRVTPLDRIAQESLKPNHREWLFEFLAFAFVLSLPLSCVVNKIK